MTVGKKSSQLFRAAVAVILLFAALLIYYIVQRPFSSALALSLLLVIVEIVASLSIFLLAGGVGLVLVPKFSANQVSNSVLQIGLGLGTVSIAFMGIGVTVGWNAWLIWGIIVVGLYSLRKQIAECVTCLSALRKYWDQSGRLGRSLAIPVLVILFSSLVVALAPPLKFDTLVYHLTLPELYTNANRFLYVEGNMYWGFPQLSQMLSAMALALGATKGALIGWGMGLLSLVGIFTLVSDYLGARRAWVSVASLLAGTSLAASMGWAYVDWPSMLMAWGAIFMLNKWSQDQKQKSVLLAGVFAAMAFGSKYTAGIIAPLGLIFVLMRTKFKWRAALPYVLAAFIAASPWLLKNAVATGNPFYPLLLQGGAMDEFRLSAYQGLPAQGNWVDLVFLPFRATFWGHEGGHVGNAPGYEASIGPLLLGLGLFAWQRKEKLAQNSLDLLRLASLIGLGGLVIWGVAGRLAGHLIRTHLYYSLFPAFAILAAFGFAALERIRFSRLRPGRIASAVILFTVVLTSTQITLELVESAAPQVLLGQISQQEYLEKNLGLHALVMKDVRVGLPEGAKVLMLWETRGYYCLPICDSDEVIDRWMHDLDSYENAGGVLNAWIEQGYSHVLYYRSAAEFVAADSEHFQQVNLTLLEDTLAGLIQVKDYKGDYSLYSLRR
jgi:hypothetical protein